MVQQKKITSQNASSSRTTSVENEIKQAENKLKAEYGSAYDKAGLEEQVTYLLKDKSLSEAAKSALKTRVDTYKNNVKTIIEPIKKMMDKLPQKHFGSTDTGFEAYKLGKEYIRIEGDTITRGIKVGSTSTSMSKVKNSITGKMSMNHYTGTDTSKSYSFKVTDKVQIKKLIEDVVGIKIK